MTPTSPAIMSCPAKVNLALSVGLPDEGGLHPIASLMTTVNYSDELTLQISDTDESSFDIAFAHNEQTSTSRNVVDWPLENDLAYRAHGMMQTHAGRSLPVKVQFQKRIPAGAGLGGGSSNAAAMLVTLNRMFDLKIATQELMSLSQPLGSDVAFAVSALTQGPAAIVSGFGDVIEPVELPSITQLVLVLPDFGCPTGKVYQAFDQLHGFKKGDVTNDQLKSNHALNIDGVRALASSDPLPQDGPFNDLAKAACQAEPKLAEAMTQLEDALDLPVHVTGSGSTMFVVAPSALTAGVLARKVTALTSIHAVATRTL